jgi:hypothetical protein
LQVPHPRIFTTDSEPCTLGHCVRESLTTLATENGNRPIAGTQGLYFAGNGAHVAFPDAHVQRRIRLRYTNYAGFSSLIGIHVINVDRVAVTKVAKSTRLAGQRDARALWYGVPDHFVR